MSQTYECAEHLNKSKLLKDRALRFAPAATSIKRKSQRNQRMNSCKIRCASTSRISLLSKMIQRIIFFQENHDFWDNTRFSSSHDFAIIVKCNILAYNSGSFSCHIDVLYNIFFDTVDENPVQTKFLNVQSQGYPPKLLLWNNTAWLCRRDLSRTYWLKVAGWPTFLTWIVVHVDTISKHERSRQGNERYQNFPVDSPCRLRWSSTGIKQETGFFRDWCWMTTEPISVGGDRCPRDSRI